MRTATCTVESSEFGYLGGTPLRMALGGDFELLGKPLGLRALSEDRAVLVDARDLDPAEKRYLADSSVTHTTVDGRNPPATSKRCPSRSTTCPAWSATSTWSSGPNRAE